VTEAPFLSHQERFAVLGSTNDVVRGWLAAGRPEVCLAVADEQTAGRGREGRRWEAPAGTALLLSLGFRPTMIAPNLVWRVPACVALAMADAAEEVAGLPDGAIGFKWPNDLVVVDELAPGGVRKLAGVLGESDGLGTDDPRVVIGIGINADWRSADFPAELAPMITSLREASGGRPIDRGQLLDAFLNRLEARVVGLRQGWFGLGDWTTRQVTTGRVVRIEYPGGRLDEMRALGVDAQSGGLVVEPLAGGPERVVHSGEIHHVRLASPGGATPNSWPVGV
jgi:BirA family biotin operon repressor/biotin-[acetyl-CoA-carboxylase] ligase